MSRKTYNLLPQVSFSILVALALKPRHGYELMKQIEKDSDSKLRLGPGALYGAIKQLLEEGLIEELAEKSDSRRRYYQLTKLGRQRLSQDIEYYEKSVRLSRQRQVLGDAIWAV